MSKLHVGLVEDANSFAQAFISEVAEGYGESVEVHHVTCQEGFTKELVPIISEIQIWFLDGRIPFSYHDSPSYDFGIYVASVVAEKCKNRNVPRYCISSGVDFLKQRLGEEVFNEFYTGIIEKQVFKNTHAIAEMIKAIQKII